MANIAAIFCAFIALIVVGAITMDLYKNRNQKSQPTILKQGIETVFKATT